MAIKGTVTGEVLINVRADSTGVIDKAGNTWSNTGTTANTTAVSADKMNGLLNRNYVLLNSGAGGLTIPKATIGNKFLIGTGDFTFACWIKTTTDYPPEKWGSIIYGGTGNSYGQYQGIEYQYSGSKLVLRMGNPDGWHPFVSPNAYDINLASPMYITITRYNKKLYMFENGILVASADSTGTYDFSNQAAYLLTDERYGSTSMQGYFDDIVLIKGQALWTSSFTPPTDNYLLDGAYYISPVTSSHYLKQY